MHPLKCTINQCSVILCAEVKVERLLREKETSKRAVVWPALLYGDLTVT